MIEVGEYVRTKDGRIYQVNSSNDEWALSDIFYKQTKIRLDSKGVSIGGILVNG